MLAPPPPRPPGPPRPTGLLAAAALATVLVTALGGCASEGGPGMGMPTSGPTSPPTSELAPDELPWPASGAADAAALQADVDGGSQPWLLDPTEVALSYVADVHGWSAADAAPRSQDPAGDVRVDVRNSSGEVKVLTLRQPGRVGRGGIWVVTAEAEA